MVNRFALAILSSTEVEGGTVLAIRTGGDTLRIKITGEIGDFPKGSLLLVLGHVGYRFVQSSNEIVYPLEKYKGQFEVIND